MANIKHARQNTIDTTKMAMESINIMRTEFSDIKYEQDNCGIMHIYKNEKNGNTLKRSMKYTKKVV